MATPDCETLMLPLLSRLKDGKTCVLKEITTELSNDFLLTAQESRNCCQREPVQDGPDGRRTAGRPDDLMIEHGLGVSVAVIYHLKRIDSDFFSED